ncbi:prolyl oligopeptidase family serine peptidase [Streptomyces sp. NPDC001508]|uniref:prolyl oligopeptidase family serine peptidase n=1 Tax=Streptomyces sp. NPDC001508 TaxID=3154656 RepID=UPI00331A596E
MSADEKVRRTRDLTEPDRHRWLEDITAERSLSWVRERNADTANDLEAGERFDRLYDELLQVLDSDERIPVVQRRGELLYNFWQDTDHPRGIWRRATLEQYRKPEPSWEVLLDVDQLAVDEDENWVWSGTEVLRPSLERALVMLSRGGADAVVVREFDLRERWFVQGGFELPEAKTWVSWIDIDEIFVGTDLGPGSLTSSGYPRSVRRWRRGTPLASSTEVFEGKPDDMVVTARHDPSNGFIRSGVTRKSGFVDTTEDFLLVGDNLIRIDVPDDAEVDLHREWLLIRTRSPWRLGDAEYPAGALLAAKLESFLAGGRDLSVLFEPGRNGSLRSHAWTRRHLILDTLVDVRPQLTVLTATDKGWQRRPVPVPQHGEARVMATDPDGSDEYFLMTSGFTEPPTYWRGDLAHPEPGAEPLKRQPAFFDATGLVAEQFFATSDDGTRVPYFVVRRPGTRRGPTLLTGYGGFEVSLSAGYSGLIGRGWLARGGTFVQAGIRGGGEYGPRWHQSALKANRHRAFEDLAAVADDLVRRGITEPARLGIRGASNGGLLAGVMLTRCPEKFGAVVCQMPLLDMLRYHLLLAGPSWTAEYGDPDVPEEREYLRRYSPYHNLKADRQYPPVLITTSTRDDRVHPGHARKMAAAMRDLGLDVSYYENIEGGHGGAADNRQLAHTWSLIFEFLWRRLGEGQ